MKIEKIIEKEQEEVEVKVNEFMIKYIVFYLNIENNILIIVYYDLIITYNIIYIYIFYKFKKLKIFV